MAANPIKGEREVQLDGKTYVIVFDWNALAMLSDEFGLNNMNLRDTRSLAKALAVGLLKHHKDEGLTPERIQDLSPPLVPTIAAVTEAYEFAYFGKDGPPIEVEADAQGNPQMVQAK